MSWFEEFNSVFFLSISTILVGAFGVAVKYCLKSKCENFSVCCGLLTINRRVDLETQEDLRRMELGLPEDPAEVELPDISSSKKN